MTAISAAAFNVGYVAAIVIIMGMVARLPMVAGWDGLLPAWWSELHPRYRTPSKAIAVVCGCGLLFAILSLVDAGNQEATQIGVAAGIGSICIQYMLLFGTILFGFRSGVRSGVWIRLAALSAFLVSLLSLIFELVPSGEVADAKVFALKVGVVIVAANGFGAFLYWRGAERLRAAEVVVEA